jgi:DNA-binding NarL/FixJ family response regulator
MTRVLLVDAQATVRRGLRMRLALEPDLTIVGEAGSGAEALSLAEALTPDVIVMGIELPDLDGIATLKKLCRTVPSTAVVLLTIYGDQDTRKRAQAAGAGAFVEKEGTSELLLAEIRRVAGGDP